MFCCTHTKGPHKSSVERKKKNRGWSMVFCRQWLCIFQIVNILLHNLCQNKNFQYAFAHCNTMDINFFTFISHLFRFELRIYPYLVTSIMIPRRVFFFANCGLYEFIHFQHFLYEIPPPPPENGLILIRW